MGIIKAHLPVKLIIAVTYCPKIDLESVTEALETVYSSIDLRSEIYNFSEFTSYYESEMGHNLMKCFLSFLNLIDPEELPSVKVATNAFEEKYKIDKNRQINLDPGYISQAKLVLATTKNYSHRIYLGQGIFGDVHLHYAEKSYRPQEWTYPDYKSPSSLIFFNKVRQRYVEQLAAV